MTKDSRVSLSYELKSGTSPPKKRLHNLFSNYPTKKGINSPENPIQPHPPPPPAGGIPQDLCWVVDGEWRWVAVCDGVGGGAPLVELPEEL